MRSPRRLTIAAALAASLLLSACGGSSSSSSSSSAATHSTQTSGSTQAAGGSQPQVGFEGVPIEQGAQFASPSTTRTGTVDGIKCGATEQLAYHIHVHLAVYVNGSPHALPGGIGIPGSSVVQSNQGPVANGGQCIYWLHTHAPDGIIHVESPTRRIYTLGQFFDEWHQPLTRTQVGDAHGTVSAFVNGSAWTKSPRAILLTPHAVIQLNVGTPIVPFHAMSWARLEL